MKKLLMTLAAAASLGFVMSCSDEVLEVNLNKDSEVVKESFTRTGTIEGTYEETLYNVLTGTQPTKTVYKKSASGNGVTTEIVDDDTYTKEPINGIDFWVRKVVRKTTFTADESQITWSKTYAKLDVNSGDTTYKDYYSKTNTDTQSYRIRINNIEYGMPTLTFGSKAMTKDYNYSASTFDADDLEAKLARFDLLAKGDVSFDEYFNPVELSLTKVGDSTYFGSGLFFSNQGVTFTGNLEDGNIQNLSLVTEREINAENTNSTIVEVGAWTNTAKLTITKFERYK